MADSSADDSLKKSQAAADLMRQAGAMAFDTIRVFTGMQQVAATGKPGALCLIDTLDKAPIGDAAVVRSNIDAEQSGSASAVKEELLTKMNSDFATKNEMSSQDNLLAKKSDLDSLASSAATKDDLSSATSPQSIRAKNATPQPFSEPNWAAGEGISRWYVPWGESSNVPADGMAGITLYYASFENPTQLAINMFTGALYTRAKGTDGWGGGSMWNKIYGQNNTTVDSNGFIKAASPILRIGKLEDVISDRGFSPAGFGGVNNEADGVTCSRLDEGVYQVDGSLGLSSDGGWSIETPKDENGQPLLWVESIQGNDGSLTIKTYHRVHPESPAFAQNNVEGKLNGEKIDIPQGRWIDLRLSMPEKLIPPIK